MKPQKSQNKQKHVIEHDAAGLLDDLLGQPACPKSDFEQLMEGSVSLPAQVPEIAVSEPVKYPAQNCVFTSIAEHAPEPEPKPKPKRVCPICGREDCPTLD